MTIKKRKNIFRKYKPVLKKGWKSFYISLGHFFDYHSVMKASALTYFSLLSVVPMAALVFAVAKNLGMEKILQQEIISRLSGREEVINWVIQLANTLLNKTKSGVIAGVGLAILFWAVIRLIMNMENAFNDIWEVKRGRSFTRKISDYTAIIIVSPIIFVFSIAITVYFATRLQSTFISGYLKYLNHFLNLLPYLLLWILFTILYKALPNTKVKFSTAIPAGIIAGSIFQIVQWAFVKFQIGVSNFNALYGSFAALPLFMIWVQTAWLIVLFGGYFSYTLQNFEKFEYDKDTEKISIHYRYSIAILIIHYIIDKFIHESPPPTVEEISEKNKLPSRLVRSVINQLEEAKIVAPVISSSTEEIGYLPAVDINKIDIIEVMSRLNHLGINQLPIAEGHGIDKIKKLIEDIEKNNFNSTSNILIKDLSLSAD
jgi:membrane protein